MKASEVFTPGKYPTVTFVDEHLVQKQEILSDALEAGAVIISLSGPSKSGKTVFVENCVGKENLLQITGAGITSTKALWDRVFDLIGTPVDVKTSREDAFQGTLGGKIGADAGFLMKAKGEFNTSGTWGTKNSAMESQTIDYLQLLIRELRGSGFILFIDDFHYIPKSVYKKP